MVARMPVPSGHSITATFASLAEARRAMAALDRAGIDARHVNLSGEAAETARARTDTRGQDARVVGHVFRRVVAGAMVGAALGVLFGFIGALVGASWSVALIAGALIGVIGGGAVGGVMGGIAGAGTVREQEMTFDRARGSVTLHVESEDMAVVEKAREVLTRIGAAVDGG